MFVVLVSDVFIVLVGRMCVVIEIMFGFFFVWDQLYFYLKVININNRIDRCIENCIICVGWENKILMENEEVKFIVYYEF